MKRAKIVTYLGIFSLTAGLMIGCGQGADETERTTTEVSTETQSTENKSLETEIAETETMSEDAEEVQGTALEITDIFEQQDAVDEGLMQEMQAGYTLEDPSVIIDPYGTSPLSAVVIFNTEEEIGGTITVKGKEEQNNITGTIKAAKEHLVPIYGLYNGEMTEVEIALDDGTTKMLEIMTEGVEINMGEISAQMIDDSAYDYSQLTFISSLSAKVYAVDAAGDIRWYYGSANSLGVHQLANGHLMMPSAQTVAGVYYKSGLVEVDLNGKVYHEYAIPGGVHHDFCELENGNLIVAVGDADLSSVEDVIVEIDRESGEVIWELDMKDLMDPEDGRSFSLAWDGTEESDWFHNNGVWYDAANDLVLLSARHVDAIVAVNRSDKTLAWVLGDPTGWELDEKYFFTPTSEDFEWQYAQHQISMLDNGDIMMFDNGTAKVKLPDEENRVTGDDVYSRAVIYRIDTENMTIEQVYQYGKERGAEWYSDWVSGVISEDGTQDNLWITAGANVYNPETDSHDYGNTGMVIPGTVKTTHIDHVVNGELAYELKIQGDTSASLSYRSFRMSPYSEDGNLDISISGQLLGKMGERKTETSEISYEEVTELDQTGWNISRDETKVTITGAYQTDTEVEDLTTSYIVLKNGDEEKVYPVIQYGAAGENKTNVTVSAWLSPTGLEGQTYQIYLVLDGVTYDSGYSVSF